MKTPTAIIQRIFNADFLNVDTLHIVNEIKNKGYFAFERALDEQYMAELLKHLN